MIRYWSFLLLAVMFCSGLAVIETVEAASSKKEKAVALFQELKQDAVGDKLIDYDNAINLLEQGGSRKELQKAFNSLMLKEDDDDTLEKVSDVYFELRLNPKPKVGGSYVDLSGYIYSYDQAGNRSRSGGKVYFWNKERTILIYTFPATQDAGYKARIWYRQYDVRAYANKNARYSTWKNDYWPPFPGPGRLDFHVYY